MPSYSLDYSKWKHIAEREALEEEDEIRRYQGELVKEPTVTMDHLYAHESGATGSVDRLHELKIKMAVEAYESRRPADIVMHHYWVKEAGDPEAIGEYFPTGEERGDGVPIYRNQHGLVMSREAHGGTGDTYSWVIGSLSDRRPLYGVRSDDLSAPTLGWQAFTAPEPVPVLRYYTRESAARTFKERGNRAFQQRQWKDAESWYSQALQCGMDEEYSEAYALLYSNRSEARMKLQDFRGAADDGDEALKYLKATDAATGLNDETRALRRKTVLRLARALQAMQRMSEAMRLLHHERRNYPECPELQRLAEATRLALRSLGRGTPSQSRSGREELGMDSQDGRKLMEYIAFIAESLQHEISNMKGRHGSGQGSPTLPAAFMALLSKLEYILLKADEVQEDVLDSLQALLQTNGVLRALLNTLEAQWKMNMEGKFVDLYKLPGATEVASVLVLLCQGNEANLRFIASDQLYLWAMLGGCNCKVRPEICERLVSLIASLWTNCKQLTLELLQSNRGAIVERVAFYLSQAVQSSPDDDPVFGPDSPAVSLACKEQAALLLLDLLSQGRSIKRRALRGIMPQLARGRSFFSSSQAAVRTLGELVAKNAVDDPQLVDDPQEVTHMLLAIQQMMKEATGEAGAEAKLDLTQWPAGRYCVILLEVVSMTLEQKMLKDRELERGAYEAAFNAGQGLETMMPLIQAPPAFAEHALRCLATMAQTYLENVEHLISLGVLQLLGAQGDLTETLASLPVARRYAARLLMQCTASKDFLSAFETLQPGVAVQQLVKLAIQLWDDGTKSAEAFQDVMHVFHALVTGKPELLSSKLREAEMLQLLLRLEKSSAPSAPLANEILTTLGKDRNFKRALAPVKRLYDEGYDPDLELKLRQQSTAMPQ